MSSSTYLGEQQLQQSWLANPKPVHVRPAAIMGQLFANMCPSTIRLLFLPLLLLLLTSASLRPCPDLGDWGLHCCRYAFTVLQVCGFDDPIQVPVIVNLAILIFCKADVYSLLFLLFVSCCCDVVNARLELPGPDLRACSAMLLPMHIHSCSTPAAEVPVAAAAVLDSCR